MDNIRVLRVVEFSGPRDLVEEQLASSMHGEKRIHKRGGRCITIKVATLGVVSEILADLPVEEIGKVVEVGVIEDETGSANA